MTLTTILPACFRQMQAVKAERDAADRATIAVRAAGLDDTLECERFGELEDRWLGIRDGVLQLVLTVTGLSEDELRELVM